MTLVFKFCAIALKLTAGASLTADALGSERPLSGLLVGFLGLVPFAWALQDVVGPDVPPAAAAHEP
ncbi:MAG: hypothetical protein ACT4QC_19565 [Planctomycetaceae bacterium]